MPQHNPPSPLFPALAPGLLQTHACVGDWGTGLSSKEKKKRKGFITPTEANVHGDARCFMAKTWARHKTTAAIEQWVAVGGWQLVVLGGCS